MLLLALLVPRAPVSAQIAGRSTGWCSDHSGRNFRCSDGPSGGGGGGLSSGDAALVAGVGGLLGGVFGAVTRGMLENLGGSPRTRRLRSRNRAMGIAFEHTKRAAELWAADRREQAAMKLQEAHRAAPFLSAPLILWAKCLQEIIGPTPEEELARLRQVLELYQAGLRLEEQARTEGYGMSAEVDVEGRVGRRIEEVRARIAALDAKTAPARRGSYAHGAEPADPPRSPGSYHHAGAAPAPGGAPLSPLAVRQDALYEKLLAKDPQDSATLELFARAAESRGDRPEALRRARIFLGRHPDHPEARAMVARLDVGGPVEVAVETPVAEGGTALRDRGRGGGQFSPVGEEAPRELVPPQADDFRMEGQEVMPFSRGGLFTPVKRWKGTKIFLRSPATDLGRLRFPRMLDVFRPRPGGLERIGEAVLTRSRRRRDHTAVEALLTRLDVGFCVPYPPAEIGGDHTMLECNLEQEALADHRAWVARLRRP